MQKNIFTATFFFVCCGRYIGRSKKVIEKYRNCKVEDLSEIIDSFLVLLYFIFLRAFSINKDRQKKLYYINIIPIIKVHNIFDK